MYLKSVILPELSSFKPYQESQETLAERGTNVYHTTIYRWVQCYTPEIEKRLQWY